MKKVRSGDWERMRKIKPRGYVCHRVPHPIAIDGALSDPAWKRAPWSEDFKDIEGDVKPAPPLRTRVKMLWDDTFFYVGARLEEHDLVAAFGDDYRAYQRKVPMLLPFSISDRVANREFPP